MLGTFFSSVCTEDDLSPIATTAEAFEGSAVEDVTATAELVRHKLSQLKTSSAAGPDGTHPRILQETEMHWRPNSQASTERERETLGTGVLPADCTLADVVPICKVLESIVSDRLMKHLEAENLLHDVQAGPAPVSFCLR